MDLGLSFEAREMSATLQAPEVPPEVYCDGLGFRTRLRVIARYRNLPRSFREARGHYKVFDRVSFSLREPPEHFETDLRPGHRRAPPVRRLPYVGGSTASSASGSRTTWSSRTASIGRFATRSDPPPS